MTNQKTIKFRYRIKLENGKIVTVIKSIEEIEDNFRDYLRTRKAKILSRNRYIEFKDKNEKEIFEGDILENKSEVICGNQFGDIVIRKRYKKGKKTEEIILKEIREQEDLEIIGNIFENPELLK